VVGGRGADDAAADDDDARVRWQGGRFGHVRIPCCGGSPAVGPR
jgi:hypothetical protein